MEVIIAPRARDDIRSILAWTEHAFGPQNLKRYEKLIATAIEQVAADPELIDSTKRPQISENCRTYHLFFSRKLAGGTRERIRRPRHFLLYRVTQSNIVEIGRVLHDSIELQAHLPNEHRSLPE